MSKLGGSRTEANLRTAFAIESQASRRFLYFAQQADVEGHPETAALFRAVAEGESGHAIGHLDFLAEIGDPATGLPIGDTEENLAAAAAGEEAEAETVYPGFAETARDEGFDEIAEWMESLGRAEAHYAKRFSEALDALKQPGSVTRSGARRYSGWTTTSSETNPPSTQSKVAEHGGWPGLLATLIDGRDLTRPAAEAAMAEILAGQATPAQIAGLLVALRAKGETVDELTGFASAMVEAAEPLAVDRRAVDIVGTGGSEHRRRHALNVSTMASVVAASAGVVICKHGNRKASSTSGSFDFLEALGVAIEIGPRQLEVCVDEVGLGFAFARTFHPAMRFAGPVRAELGIPTVFNLLGPLANPGRVSRQVVGVSSPERAALMAEALQSLGSVSAWVVAGAGGLDELSTGGDSLVFEVSPDAIEERVIGPGSLGIPPADLADLAGGSAEANAAIFERLLRGELGPYRDVVVLNAAAAVVVAGEAPDLPSGLVACRSAIDDGRALAKLDQLRVVSNRLHTT